jgi:hypothetical protein
LIARREFEIKEAVWDEIDGVQHVRVTFSTPHVYGVDDRDNPFQSGVLWLNPNRYWTIRRATAVMEMPQYRSEITFERPESDPSSPAPIPGATSVTRVTTSTNGQLGGTVVEETVYSLSFDHPTPSNSEFTLRAFGLDELDALAEQEAPQSKATWPWMAAFAIGSIALALAILWFKRKKR